jgi:hypothetical protein
MSNSSSVTVATEQLGALTVEVNWRPRNEAVLSALLAAAADLGAQQGRSLVQQLEAADGDAEERALLRKLARGAVLLGRELRVALKAGQSPWHVLEEVRCPHDRRRAGDPAARRGAAWLRRRLSSARWPAC